MKNIFSELILYRNAYKRLNNLSWTLQQSEKRFPLGDDVSETQLLKIYKSLVFDVVDITQDLKRLEEQK